MPYEKEEMTQLSKMRNKGKEVMLGQVIQLISKSLTIENQTSIKVGKYNTI